MIECALPGAQKKKGDSSESPSQTRQAEKSLLPPIALGTWVRQPGSKSLRLKPYGSRILSQPEFRVKPAKSFFMRGALTAFHLTSFPGKYLPQPVQASLPIRISVSFHPKKS